MAMPVPIMLQQRFAGHPYAPQSKQHQYQKPNLSPQPLFVTKIAPPLPVQSINQGQERVTSPAKSASPTNIKPNHMASGLVRISMQRPAVPVIKPVNRSSKHGEYYRKAAWKVVPKMGYLLIGQDRERYLDLLTTQRDGKSSSSSEPRKTAVSPTTKLIEMRQHPEDEVDHEEMSDSEGLHDLGGSDQENNTIDPSRLQNHDSSGSGSAANDSNDGENEAANAVTFREAKGLRKLNKVFWTKQEDEMLASIVEVYGARRWDFLARTHMAHRNGMQLRSRWTYVINRKDARRPFTSDEDLLILKEHQEHPGCWSFIANLLYNRTDQEIKHRFRKLQRKAKKIVRQRF